MTSKKRKRNESSQSHPESDPSAATDSHDKPSSTTAMDVLIPPQLKPQLKNYELRTYHIQSSTKMTQKVTSITSGLQKPTIGVNKPILYILHAKAPAGNKLVGIVEIAKREMAQTNVPFYQYTHLTSNLEERKLPKPRQSGANGKYGETVETDGADQADFEQLLLPRADGAPRDKPLVRAVPILVTFLCGQRIKALQSSCSEQTKNKKEIDKS